MGLIDELRSSGSKLIDSLKVDMSVPPIKRPEITPVPQSASGQAIVGGLKDFAAGFVSDPSKQTQDPRWGSLPYVAGAAIASSPLGGVPRSVSKVPKVAKQVAQEVPEVFSGLKNLTLKTLEKLKGRSTVSKQFISDLTNAADIKQAERDIIRRVLDDYSTTDNVLPRFKSTDKDFERYVNNVYDEFSKKKSNILESAQSVDPKITNVRLGGSYGRGKPTPESDIDLEFIYDGTPPENLYEKLAGQYHLGDGVADAGVIKGSDQIPVKEFANKVETELLPLKVGNRTPPNPNTASGGKYESVTLPDELRGPIANYGERIYESPIKTSAGDVHFRQDSAPNYFAHTRIEDVADPSSKITGNEKFSGKFAEKPTKTRRVIEIQSDLFQKGRLEQEAVPQVGKIKGSTLENALLESDKPIAQRIDEFKRRGFSDAEINKLRKLDTNRAEIETKLLAPGKERIAKLEPYRNTWHERVIREEIKQAAKDGKTKLQFPTGETIAKIEGWGNAQTFKPIRFIKDGYEELGRPISQDDLKIGNAVLGENGRPQFITAVRDNGTFRSVDELTAENTREIYDFIAKNKLDIDGEVDLRDILTNKATGRTKIELLRIMDEFAEGRSISGKVDFESLAPEHQTVYKFYEKDVSKYLNKFGGKKITDAQGVSWIEVPIKKEQGKMPIEAFGVLPAIPLIQKPKDKKKD